MEVVAKGAVSLLSGSVELGAFPQGHRAPETEGFVD